MNAPVINPVFSSLSGFIKELPERFLLSGNAIYEDRNTIKTFEVNGLKMAVKSFKIPFFLNKIVYTFFRQSKAKRSYEYALRLQEKGVDTPVPVAYIENKQYGLLRDSYYACELVEYDGMMRVLRTCRLEECRDLIVQFARFTAQTHEKEVLHLDYSPGNILFTCSGGVYTFYLVDINRMRFGKVSPEEGCKNLRKLWGSKRMIEEIAREYARARGFDEKSCVELTLKYHDCFWKKFTGKHGRRPYDLDE